LTDEVEREAEVIFAELMERGRGSMLAGVLDAIEAGWFQGEIADAAFELERRLNQGRRVVVGVNRFTDADEGTPPILQVGRGAEELQRKRLDAVKRARSQAVVDESLRALAVCAHDADANVMPALIDASRARATVGEMVAVLEDVFGTWVEQPRV
jgi:methylmalonyl-CoA mutase N-terminal domain/subunit